MSNSALVSYTALSPNHSGKRNHVIDTITIHCMAGNLSVEGCGQLFANRERQASSNYGIGSDGRIALYVDEANRSWCSSSSSNDNRAVTIEVANTVAAEPWPVSEKAYAALLDLVTDICRRNGIKKLLWKADKSLIGKVSEQNMTVHRWFANKSCPGDWLYKRHGEIAAEVNKRLEKEDFDMDINEARKKLTSCAETGDTPSEWAREAAEYCKRKGIFNGDGAGNYGWQQPITREAVAQIVYNALEMAGVLEAIPDKR
jgi:hypothetical protein